MMVCNFFHPLVTESKVEPHLWTIDFFILKKKNLTQDWEHSVFLKNN